MDELVFLNLLRIVGIVSKMRVQSRDPGKPLLCPPLFDPAPTSGRKLTSMREFEDAASEHSMASKDMKNRKENAEYYKSLTWMVPSTRALCYSRASFHRSQASMGLIIPGL